jgi:hypothetical protein
MDNIEYSIHKQESGGNLLLKPQIIEINNLNKLSQYNFCNSKIISCIL